MTDKRSHRRRPTGGLFGLAAALVALSCSNKQSLNVTCASDLTCQPAADPTAGASSGPVTLASFSPPRDPGPGGIIFAASGEVLALSGYPFPPASPGDPAFADGWSVQFTRLLVTLDDVTLSDGPNVSPGDQSCTEPVVAKVSGPWAIDLAHGDPGYLPGKGGGGEQAVPFAALSHQNYPPGNDAAFDTGGATPYAFGFDVVPASAGAMNVNLDAGAQADYRQMIAQGCTVLYVGTATFKGTSCTCPTASDGSAPCDPNIYGPGKGWPQLGDVVPFRLCFQAPASYLNCQNPDNTGAPLAGDEFQRGITFQANAPVVAQVTIHTDHPFWDSVLHDTPVHFDQLAARVVGMGPPGTGVTYPTVTLEMTRGVDDRRVTDALGNVLSWRYCAPPDTSVHSRFVGPMAFDAESVAHAPGANADADACKGLRDYHDFATYDQSTQGHLNSDGLCYVVRHYPSPR